LRGVGGTEDEEEQGPGPEPISGLAAGGFVNLAISRSLEPGSEGLPEEWPKEIS
jgi:hypothetical protein